MEQQAIAIFILLAVYQEKHYVADFLLQGTYMLGKFKPFPQFILPLLAHAGVHALFTFFIAFAAMQVKGAGIFPYFGLALALKLALFDGVVHFIVDRIKASPKLLGRHESLSKNEFLGLLKEKDELEKLGSYEFEIAKIDAKFRSNVMFWRALGLDQKAHHLTHYIIIYFLVR